VSEPSSSSSSIHLDSPAQFFPPGFLESIQHAAAQGTTKKLKPVLHFTLEWDT
jgi:hypothetical protein